MKKFIFLALIVSTTVWAKLPRALDGKEAEALYNSMPVAEEPSYTIETLEINGYTKTGDGFYCARTLDLQYYSSNF